MIDYYKQRGRGGEITKTGDIRTVQDRVDEGELEQNRANQLVNLYVELGVLPKGTTPQEARIYGESAKVYNARKKVYEYVSRLHDGADPLVLVEEEAESYFKQALDNGNFSLDEVEAWRAAVEGKPVTPKADKAMRHREATEWFSRYAQAYITGKTQENAPVPLTFRRWLDKMRKVFAEIFQLARDLIEKEKAGQLPDDFKKHLSRAVGLDEAFIEDRMRQEEREQAAKSASGNWRAAEALHEIKLPTPNREADGWSGELQNLWTSMKFDQRMKLFAAHDKSLDKVAELLREDYGFSWVKGPDDVVKLAEDTFLHGKEVTSDRGESTMAVRREPKTEEARALMKQFIGRDDNFWGIVVDEEEGSSQFTDTQYSGTQCTGFACAIRNKLGDERVKIYGFSDQKNPESEIAQGFYGHDFAVVDGRYIVDPWVNEIYDQPERGVFDLQDPQDKADIRRLYGKEENWTEGKRDGQNVTFADLNESTMSLRKHPNDKTGDLFGQEDMPFNLDGGEAKDHEGAMDRRAESDQAKQKGAAAQQMIDDRAE